jgi:serine/threonine protein kinase/tetratricopeptide (TPR) repeat protein
MVCPRCGKLVLASAGHCKSCGAGIAVSVLTPPPTSTTPHDEPQEINDESLTVALSAQVSTPGSAIDAPPQPAHGSTPDDEEANTSSLPTPTSLTIAIPSAARPVHSGPLAIGESFGNRYHVIRMVGVGGMGAVYQAWDGELGMAVAIKVIRREVTENSTAGAEVERRFKRELVLARQVTHKNVVRIHDLGEIDGIKYITMPYVEGEDLATVLRKEGRLPVAKTLHIVRSIVSGLVAAHAAGVVHRDLKPANIMIETSDEALIMDFGIARSTGAPTGNRVPGNTTIISNLRLAQLQPDATVLGTVVGTVEYMAPEQARGVSVDQRADVYALGLIIYDMLVGRSRLTMADSAIAELRGRMEQAPPSIKSLVPEVPDALNTLVSRCLEPDPAKRYQTSADLAADLDRLDDHGVPIPEPRRFTPRLIAASVLLVIALVAGTWWLTRTPPLPKPHDPVSVLIADFQNQTNDPSFDRTLEPIFKLALEGAGFISAYDRLGMRTIGARPPERLDERVAQEIAVKQAVGVVLAGSLTRDGGGYTLDAKVIQAVTGSVIATVTQKAKGKDKVLALATTVATSIRKALGDNTSDDAQRFAMDTLSTANLDAVHDYAMGQVALADNRSEEAIRSYAKAIERDSKFVAAYTGIALASGNVGRQQDAEKYAKEALKHLDGATERERYRVRGAYSRLTGDYQQCVKEYGELVARYTADAAARNQLALCMSKLRQLGGARDEMQRVSSILPRRALYRVNLSLYAAYGNDYQTAESAAAEAIKLSSAEPSLIALFFVQLGQNQLAHATETLQKLAALSPLGASVAASGLADIALYEGRFNEAASILGRGIAADLAAGNRDRAATKSAALAYTRLQQKDNTKAVVAAQQALGHSQAANIKFFAGRVFIEAGDFAKGKTLAAALGGEPQTEPRALAKILEADLALKGKQPKQAIGLLTEANKLLDTWLGHFDLGRAHFDDGALLAADSEFDGCLRRRGEALSLLLDEEPTYGYLPGVYYYQGRVREGLKTSAFAESYRSYLGIREKAGEDPLVAEVRRRAGR